MITFAKLICRAIDMRNLLTSLLLAAVSLSVFASGGYERKTFVSEQGDSLHYRLLAPESVRQGDKYPLVIFLHGAGERGDDNEKQLTHGSQMFLNPVNREQYLAYVLFPQCPEDGYWAYPSRPESFESGKMPANPELTPVFNSLKQLIDKYAARTDVDNNRIYIMGLSMGGMGTYDMACRYPDTFAAAVAICGSVNPSRLKAAKDVKWRIFHGDADNVVPVDCSRDAYRALKAAGADVEYIEFPGCNHGSWNPAFCLPDFMQWLFSKRKK